MDNIDYIEEKTPGGITLKVMFKNWNFLAFDKNGTAIYADEQEKKILHSIPVMFFYGMNFKIEKKIDSLVQFFKIIKGEIVIPFTDLRKNTRKYLFIKTEEKMDLIPAKIAEYKDIALLVQKKLEFEPDYIIVDSFVKIDDTIILNNKFPEAIIILADDEKWSLTENEYNNNANKSRKRRAVEEQDEKNLNIMSNNPVFLSRIHLRRLALSKVNQLLLDFDLSPVEAEYILKFIETMLQRDDNDEELLKNKSKLEDLHNSFLFYIYLVNRNDKEIKGMINLAEDLMVVISYNTLVAKMKSFYQKEEDQLLFTEYENILFEKKDQIQGDKE